MILEEIQHHLDRIEAAQKRCEEQPTDVATIVVLLNALAMAVKDRGLDHRRCAERWR